ncbi:hypothetical protein [Massilia sp. X63]|uniref:hypothetical protein n=1 Tax=Massilia sp. X63 TaxID=3237285 RepID=UPI0034DD674C
MIQDRRITDKLPGRPLQWEEGATPSAAPAADAPMPNAELERIAEEFRMHADSDDDAELRAGGEKRLIAFDYFKRGWITTKGAAPAAGQAGLAKPEDLRRAICSAVVNCGHVIDDERVMVMANPKQEGNALSQLVDRIAAIPTLAAPVAADTRAEGATEQASCDAKDLIAIAAQLREVNHWAAQTSVALLDEIAGRMLKAAPAAPLATPADAGAGQQPDEHVEFPHSYRKWDLRREDYVAPPFAAPASQQAASGEVLTNSEIFGLLVHIRPDAYGMPGCGPDFEGYDLACARAIEREVVERVGNAIRLAHLSTSGAPVTAEPVATDTPLAESLRHTANRLQSFADRLCNDKSLGERYEGDESELRMAIQQLRHFARIAATPAPADRDAIRAEALEEAIVAHKQTRNWQAVDTVRALKSMERAADAAETLDTKGGE